jgi:hypothetical protein
MKRTLAAALTMLVGLTASCSTSQLSWSKAAAGMPANDKPSPKTEESNKESDAGSKAGTFKTPEADEGSAPSRKPRPKNDVTNPKLREMSETIARLEEEKKDLEGAKETLESARDAFVFVGGPEINLGPYVLFAHKDEYDKLLGAYVLMGQITAVEAAKIKRKSLERTKVFRKAVKEEIDRIDTEIEKTHGEISYYLDQRARLREASGK